MDPIDKRVYAEYLVWLAFTAVPLPFEQPRYIWSRNYFNLIGFVAR